MKFTLDTTKIPAQIKENPLLAAAAGSAVLSGLAKLINANTGRKNSKTYRREVARREKLRK